MNAAFCTCYRMNLIYDYCLNPRKHAPPTDRGEHYVKRLGRRDEHMRRLANHARARRRGRITRAHGHANLGKRLTGRGEALLQLRQRPLKVPLNVVVERFQRRDVQDMHRVRERRLASLDDEVVQLPEERGEGLTCPRRRENERVRAACDRRPTLLLRLTRRPQPLAKPHSNERVKRLQCGRHWRALRHTPKADPSAPRALGKMER